MPDQRTAVIVYNRIERDDEADAAILIVLDEEKYWIPRSQIIDHDEAGNAIEIPEWLAIEKELV
jgi:hypothetical protein